MGVVMVAQANGLWAKSLKQIRKARREVVIGVAIALIGTVIVTIFTAGYAAVQAMSASPIDVQLKVGNENYGDCDDFGLPNSPTADKVAVPTDTSHAAKDAWIQSNRAEYIGYSTVEVRVQATNDNAVVLKSMRVVVDSRSPAATKTSFEVWTGCGGGFIPRSFQTKLDDPTPVLAVNPEMVNGNEAPGTDFPYTVSRDDPETFVVFAEAVSNDVKWHLELSWYTAGKEGTKKIDNGKPFYVLGNSQLQMKYTCIDPASGWTQ
jgi:hypothetical protein